MRSPIFAAALAAAAMLVLASCVSSNTIEGHQVRGTAEVPAKQTVKTDLHASAPQWFKDHWQRYLRDADGNYAVFAADRNGRGTGYIYCAPGYGIRCSGSGAGWTSAFKDTEYKYPAVRRCEQIVRRDFPALKPDCAIYAIKDTIVWKGRMPWE